MSGEGGRECGASLETFIRYHGPVHIHSLGSSPMEETLNQRQVEGRAKLKSIGGGVGPTDNHIHRVENEMKARQILGGRRMKGGAYNRRSHGRMEETENQREVGSSTPDTRMN